MFAYVLWVAAQSCLTLAAPQTAACQAPLSMGFSYRARCFKSNLSAMPWNGVCVPIEILLVAMLIL